MANYAEMTEDQKMAFEEQRLMGHQAKFDWNKTKSKTFFSSSFLKKQLTDSSVKKALQSLPLVVQNQVVLELEKESLFIGLTEIKDIESLNRCLFS